MDRDKLIEDAQIEQNELDLDQEPEPDALEFDGEIEEEDVKAPIVEHFDDAIKLYLREIQKTDCSVLMKKKTLPAV